MPKACIVEAMLKFNEQTQYLKKKLRFIFCHMCNIFALTGARRNQVTCV